MTDKMEMGINNHYVPRFILKHFGEGISCFNVRTGEYLDHKTPEHVFSDRGIYPDYLEKKFNERLEGEFSKKLWGLLKKDVIELKRKDLWLIKKFLIIAMIRTPDTQSFTKKFRRLHEEELAMSKGAAIQYDYLRYLYGDYADDLLVDLDDEEYLIRTVECILDLEQLTVDDVNGSDNGTAWANYLVRLFSIGYLGFWDAAPGDSFVITDVGMTSENEIGWSEGLMVNKKKSDVLEKIANMTCGKDSEWDMQMKMMLFNSFVFHENFMLFSISSSRMIVLINPFFKFMLTNEWMFGQIGCENVINALTCIPDKRLFKPNESICDMMGEHRDNDLYTYRPVKLTAYETRYCNSLFMDRVHEWLGFESLDGLRGSAEVYKKMAGSYARNDYAILYDILSKSQ